LREHSGIVLRRHIYAMSLRLVEGGERWLPANAASLALQWA